MNEFGNNMNHFESLSNSQFEALDSFTERLETNPESVSDSEILSKFDDNQLNYIGSIQENPSWAEMSVPEKFDYVNDSIGKFCQDTYLDKLWKKPSLCHPIVHCIVRNMSKL